MGLKTFPQLKAAGLMPLSREQLRRAIKAGHYEPGVRFGGPRSREHWDEDYARARAGLDRAAISRAKALPNHEKERLAPGSAQ